MGRQDELERYNEDRQLHDEQGLRESLGLAVGCQLTASAIVAEFIAGATISECAAKWKLYESTVEDVIRREMQFLLRHV